MTSEPAAILLVEDEALIAFEAEDILQDLGYAEIETCATFRAAEEAVDGGRFAVGMFDLNLNGVMSTPLVERFTAAGGRAILTTGYEVEAAEIARLGAVHVRKPYTARDIAAALAAACRDRDASAA